MMRMRCEVCHRFLISNYENMQHAKICRHITADEFRDEIDKEGIREDLFTELRLKGYVRR